MIDKRYQIKQLSDKAKLQEIYNLRVSAWENSANQAVVNSDFFSKGWFDDFDETAIHWIIEDETEKIIAAARLNIIATVQAIPYASVLELPKEMPMAFLSRLVVDVKHRRNGLGSLLKQVRMEFCKAHPIDWILVFATDEQRVNFVQKSGWTIAGQMEIQFHRFAPALSVNAFIKKL
jgi:predicted GNAT family N-acyltransferase